MNETANGRYVVEGRGTMTLHNASASRLQSLPLHLYMNAFAKGSLALSLPSLDGRAALSVADAEGGALALHDVRDNRDGALLDIAFATPDADRTTAQVLLLHPIEPNESASFDLRFTTTLPNLTQRTGNQGSFVFVGQWFPKLAKLEPDGSFTQFVFHPQAEFYANFGNYEITLDTEAGYVVGASGTLVDETQDAGRRVARYVANDVHDFAWTAWPEFMTHEVTIGDTQVRVLFPPGNELNRDVTLDAVEKALPWFESWLGEYPLPALTIVHPPDFAESAGGMEYPGLITTGGPRLASLVSDDIERVVIHELAHQWFYGSVASNEYAWPFLDEGLSLYAENRAVRELYTGRKAELLHFVTSLAQYTSSHAARHDAAIATGAASFSSFGQLAALAYDRAALVFETFARVYGPTFDRALGDYARTYTAQHPTPEDLFQSMEGHLATTPVETLRRALFDRGSVNYRVETLEHAPDANDVNLVVTRVVLTRQGSLSFPVLVRLTDAQGTVDTQSWSNETPELELRLVRPTPIVDVCVDAERTVLLDDEPKDNCKRTPFPSPTPYGAQLLLVLQSLVMLLSW